jgi:16S rRNA (cytosine1402-N4)-methyltransferase
MENYHVSVLLSKTIDMLSPKKGGIYVDATLGGGGHLKEIIKRVENKGTFIGIDQDEDAINEAKKDLLTLKGVYLVRDNFKNIINILGHLKIDKIDGIVFDLGVSSYQLDEKSRGFSYMQDAPLDMRMDKRSQLTAEYVVNKMSQEELKRVIKFMVKRPGRAV